MSYQRFTVLSLFCWLSAINGFSWLMFDPAEKALTAAFSPNFDSFQLKLLSSWQPAMYMLVAPLATKALMRANGLQWVMRAGIAVELLGSVLKLCAFIAPHRLYSLVLLHVGQILSATTSPIAIGTPAHLSAVWFPEEERARATGAGVLFNNIGNGFAYITIPAVAAHFGYEYVVVMEFAQALVLCVLTFAFAPAEAGQGAARRSCPNDSTNSDGFLVAIPESERDAIHAHVAGADGGAAAGGSLKAELGALFRNPTVVILCGVYAWSSGGYVAWTSLMDDLLSRYGRWSDEFIGLMTFTATVAYIVGGFVAAALTDKKLRFRMKELLVAACAVATVGCALLAISVPSPFADGIILDWGNGWLVFVSAVCGFCNGAAAPVFYELVAEVSYPVSEAVSGNLLSYFENGGSLLLYQGLGNVVSPQVMNVGFAAGMLLVSVVLVFARAAYRRSAWGAPGAEEDAQWPEADATTVKTPLMESSPQPYE
jgi:MFS family permease